MDIKPAAPLRKAVLSALSERDPKADICRVDDAPDGAPEPDPDLRDTENVPLPADFPLPAPLAYGPKADNTALVQAVRAHCEAWFEREVRPHVSDAWVDWSKTKLGFEIPFNRHFYSYTPPRPLEDIEAELRNARRRDRAHARRGGAVIIAANNTRHASRRSAPRRVSAF